MPTRNLKSPNREKPVSSSTAGLSSTLAGHDSSSSEPGLSSTLAVDSSDEDFYATCIKTSDPAELERRRQYRLMINEKWSQPESAENPHDLIVDMENPFWTLYADLTRNDHMSGELWVQLNPEYLEAHLWRKKSRFN